MIHLMSFWILCFHFTFKVFCGHQMVSVQPSLFNDSMRWQIFPIHITALTLENWRLASVQTMEHTQNCMQSMHSIKNQWHNSWDSCRKFLRFSGQQHSPQHRAESRWKIPEWLDGLLAAIVKRPRGSSVLPTDWHPTVFFGYALLKQTCVLEMNINQLPVKMNLIVMLLV